MLWCAGTMRVQASQTCCVIGVGKDAAYLWLRVCHQSTYACKGMQLPRRSCCKPPPHTASRTGRVCKQRPGMVGAKCVMEVTERGTTLVHVVCVCATAPCELWAPSCTKSCWLQLNSRFSLQYTLGIGGCVSWLIR